MNKNIIIFIIALICLAGCSDEYCIEADDFGHAQITVSSRYTSEEFGPEQVGENQVAPWRDSNYRTNGRPLTIAVRGWEYGIDYNTEGDLSAWCPWYADSKNPNILSSLCQRLSDCKYVDGVMCTKTYDARITNAPCLFRNGIGLYALISEKNKDPNLTLTAKRNPQGISFHLGEKISDYRMYEFDKNGNVRDIGGRVFNYSGLNKGKYADAKIYFKILDKFYDDNNGQYKLIIKSGIARQDPDPISYVTRLVKEFLFGTENNHGVIRGIYTGIVNNPAYRLAVSALLTLYIIFTALSYLSGNIQVTHTELLVRVLKISIVSALISSEYSWSFFNDYLFVYFIGGVEQILQMITEAGGTGPGSPGILAMMSAPQTLAKLLSLLFVDWLGFIYIILFIIALYFVVMVFFKAAIIYLTAIITIGMIIVMGPIFISFLLFGITRSLFENWLKQLISYSIQPIILFTGLIFISMILRQEIYSSLGFRVCKRNLFVMQEDEPLFAQGTESKLLNTLRKSIFYWWFPSPLNGQDFIRTTNKIPVPIDHFTSDNDVVGSVSDRGFCEAYACIEDRYIDLPFLDPKSTRDNKRLNQFWVGNFVQLDGLLLIFIAIYLLHKFNSLTISVARFLSNSSGNLTNISNVGDAVHAQTFMRLNKKIAAAPLSAVDKAIGRGDIEKGRMLRRSYTNLIKEAPSMLVDKIRINGIFNIGGLKREALSKNANKAVLAEVAKRTGLTRDDVKQHKTQIKDYKKLLADKLKIIAPTLSKKKLDKLVKELSKRQSWQLNDEFAKAKYGKILSDLTDEQKKIIKDLNDKELRKLAINVQNIREFQNEYVNAFAAMSDRNISIFGKNAKAIRSIEEFRSEQKRRKDLQNLKQRKIGESLYAEIDELKAKAYKQAFGDNKYDPRHKDDGSAWYGINRDSNTKETYFEESLIRGAENIKRSEIRSEITDLSTKYGNNVTSPEFLFFASLNDNPDLDKFEALAYKDIHFQVQDYFTQGNNPVFKGETYMNEHATDSEMKTMIDKAYQLEKSIINDDIFIKREEQYTLLLEDSEPDSDSHVKFSQTLEKINERKEMIRDIVNRQVKRINEYRAKAGMNQYYPNRR